MGYLSTGCSFASTLIPILFEKPAGTPSENLSDLDESAKVASLFVRGIKTFTNGSHPRTS
jgi:hypothetical protein